jgi:nicotinate-nucleotide adenylyltransferase
MADDKLYQARDTKSRMGIMGGSFDPIHNGHLKIAEVSKNKFDLEKVIFVPAYCPPHKSRPVLAPFEHRSAMIRMAIEGRCFFEVSEIERKECCPSYAGNTVKELKGIYGAECHYYFITGLDALLTLTNWEKSRTYPGLCYFIATTRPGFNRTAIEREIPNGFLPYIIVNEMPALSVSSTDIRHRIRTNQSLEGLVPEKVQNYIYDHNIYINCFT